MKKTLFILLMLTLILFIDYVLLIAFGWSASELGAQDKFYCGFYCKFGVSLLVLSFVVIVILSRRFLAKNQIFKP
nr:hypothetical protein [Labilibaculum sp.]